MEYGIRNPPDKRDKQLKQIIQNESWVIEGVYYSWLDDSFSLADYIFILKPSVYLRDWRIIKRFFLRRLGSKPSLKKDTLNSVIKLIKWNHQYDNGNLRNAMALLEKHQHKTYQLKNNEDLFKYIQD
ncbi:hypothetical protein [Tuberibacillus sp. Marseille-P3662]|uniref:hypothetical protein n=1 Tax=Tuberibacillus sp. Marseille-P3662 TaxID=1965358 RepID=UPI000A1C892E|nr:hypothetical protein [Tuberibacillus sp. Marseille-P3662]